MSRKERAEMEDKITKKVEEQLKRHYDAVAK